MKPLGFIVYYSTPAEPNHYAEANLYEVFRAASNLNQRYIYDSETMPSAADDDDASEPTLPPKPPSLEVNPEVESTPSKVDYEKYRPYFLHVPKHKVQKTFENTTQHATNIQSGIHVGMTLKSPYPAFNVWRRHEPVATDTIEAKVPAIDGGCKYAQIFVGRKSLVIDVFGMTSSSEFVNTLEDVIRKRGAMDKLTSNSATGGPAIEGGLPRAHYTYNLSIVKQYETTFESLQSLKKALKLKKWSERFAHPACTIGSICLAFQEPDRRGSCVCHRISGDLSCSISVQHELSCDRQKLLLWWAPQ